MVNVIRLLPGGDQAAYNNQGGSRQCCQSDLSAQLSTDYNQRPHQPNNGCKYRFAADLLLKQYRC